LVALAGHKVTDRILSTREDAGLDGGLDAGRVPANSIVSKAGGGGSLSLPESNGAHPTSAAKLIAKKTILVFLDFGDASF
jgi:hypothetical protein